MQNIAVLPIWFVQIKDKSVPKACYFYPTTEFGKTKKVGPENDILCLKANFHKNEGRIELGNEMILIKMYSEFNSVSIINEDYVILMSSEKHDNMN